MIKLLIFWDIFWRNWRKLVHKFLPGLREKYNPDFVIWNSENLTSGRWPSLKHIKELHNYWFDCLTWWDHIFENIKDIKDYINSPESIQIRPINYTDSKYFKFPWVGYKKLEKNWKKLLVVNLLSNNLRDTVENSFLSIDKFLSEQKEEFDWIVVDYHKEYSSEIYMLSMFLDSKTSFVYGTHTHVQTNDDHILPGGTGMICDVWMVGALNSSIGQTYDSRILGFLTGTWAFSKPEQDMWHWIVYWVYVEIEDKKCVKIEKIKIVE